MEKRFLAGILAMAMVLTAVIFIPFSGSAEETERTVLMAAAYDAAGNDQMNPLTPANLAADGDSETFWTVFSEAVSGYIVIDLGEEQNINTVKFTDQGAKITDYTFEYSSDAAEWSELGMGGYPEAEEKIDVFPTVKARYVRLNINSCKTGENESGFRIGEIEIYLDPDTNIVLDPSVKKIYKDVLPVGAEGEAISLLSALGIVSGDENGYFKPNAQITRGEFAQIIANIFAEDLRTGAEPPFGDIDGEAWLAEAVSTVYTYGLMYGDGDGYFRPNDPITGAEAAKTLVALTGYSSLAEANGGYFDGYFVIANQIGILKNLDIAFDTPITREQVAIMVANSLEVELLDIIGISDQHYSIYSNNENTLLGKYARIYKERGIVTANELTGMDSTAGAKDGMVQIRTDGVEEAYLVGTSDVQDYLGHQIEFYYSVSPSNGDKTIRYFSDYNTTVEEISPEDIQSLQSGVLAYYKDDKSVRRSIEDTAPVIKNGVYMGKLAHALTMEDDLNFSSGELVLIDNNRDSKSDLVVIRSYINGLVEAVSKTVNQISLKATTGIPFDFNNEKNRILKDGVEISADELKAFDVVSAMVSENGEVTTVYVSPYAAVEGTVEKITEESIFVDGLEYELCDRVNLNSQIHTPEEFRNKLNLGSTVTLYFNIEHKIAGVFGGSAQNEYGYLVDVAFDTSSFDGELMLKIFTQSGNVSVYECENKIDLNGSKLSAEEVYSRLLSGSVPRKQMIRFSANNENKVNKLILPDIEAGAAGTPYRGDDSLIPYGDPYQFVSQRFYWKKGLGNVNSGVKEFSVSDNTIVFQIPTDGNEKNYRILSRDTFADSQTYDVLPYNVNSTGEVAVLAVSQSTSASVDAGSQVYLVTDVATTVDQDGMEALQLTCVSKGSQVSLQCDEDTVVTRYSVDSSGNVVTGENNTVTLPVEAVKPGALIQYSSGNPVKGIQLLYPLSEDYENPDSGWRYSYGWSGEKIFGKVLAVNGSNIAVDTGAMTCYYSLDFNTKFHVWDVQLQQGTEATAADILSAENVGEDSASYFFYMPYTKSMFVFNF